jgi:hypothetical protein
VNAETDLCSVAVVSPNAGQKTIAWMVRDAGGTGVTDVVNNRFKPTAAGTLVLTARVAGGTNCTEWTITVNTMDDRRYLAGTVSITTNAIKGTTLAGVTGTLIGESGVPVYHWQRSGNSGGPWADIDGAYRLTYTLTDADVDKYIRINVGYSGNKNTVASNAVGPVKASLPAKWTPDPFNVSNATAWRNLLTQIQNAADRYAALDLSKCTMSGTEFDPGPETIGVDKIVSLILPGAATGIKAGSRTWDGATASYDEVITFKNWTALTAVRGANITAVGDYAFSNCAALTTANFPKATTIGDCAFSNCAALTTANFPKAKTIGDCAFSNCAALTTANFPKSETIGNCAFSRAALSTADFPKATALGEGAFANCAALSTANFPKAETIGTATGIYGTFESCAALSSASIPKVTAIGRYAFWNCAALSTVSLPASLTSIGAAAFFGCAALASVNFPAGLTTIGGGAFSGCRNLTTITVDAGNPHYASRDDKILLNKAGTTLYAYPSASGAVAVDAAITTIGDYAFSGCVALKTVYAPGVTSIGRDAFSGCGDLASVSLPAAASIDDYAFSTTGATALTVTLGSTVPLLGDEIFSGVTSAKTVTVRVPSGVLGYGTSPTDNGTVNWGNGFRGGGWAASAFTSFPGGTRSINSNITLTIKTIQCAMRNCPLLRDRWWA